MRARVCVRAYVRVRVRARACVRACACLRVCECARVSVRVRASVCVLKENAPKLRPLLFPEIAYYGHPCMSVSAPIQLVFPSHPAGSRRSYVPLEAAVTIVSNEECGRLYRMTIPHGKLCAGTGDADTCTVGDGW